MSHFIKYSVGLSSWFALQLMNVFSILNFSFLINVHQDIISYLIFTKFRFNLAYISTTELCIRHNAYLNNICYVIHCFFRFMRELDNLKETTDYSSKDSTGLQKFLKSISSKFVIYTYPMLSAGVNMNTIRLDDFQLFWLILFHNYAQYWYIYYFIHFEFENQSSRLFFVL